jgi:opacity protein-like surface antigen
MKKVKKQVRHILVESIRTASAAVLIFACAPAFAQDDDWTGFYIGGQADGTIDDVQADATLAITQVSNLFVTGRGFVIVPSTVRPYEANDHSTNFDGGAHAGYLWQSGSFVFGAEGDFVPLRRHVSATQIQAIPQTLLTPSVTIASERDLRLGNQWSARARLGYAFGKTLAYATGGYARTQAHVTSIDSFTNPGGPAAPCASACPINLGPEGPVVTTASESQSFGGWAAGGGIEQRVGRHISIALEYRHTDFGSRTFALSNQTVVNTGPTTVGTDGQPGQLGSVSTGPTQIALKGDSLGIRLNWRF